MLWGQVEMMAETEFGAQLLLQGHRRLRRTRTTSTEPLRMAVEITMEYFGLQLLPHLLEMRRCCWDRWR